MLPESRPALASTAAQDASREPSQDHDLLDMGQGTLTPLERAQIRFIRASLRAGPLDRSIRLLQRTVGQFWIRAATTRISRIVGMERLPPWNPARSFVLVANHRSFFDLYVAAAELVARGLPQRIIFPVRSTFFYDHPLGPLVNGAMSFFAMYPPIFRERARAALNVASLDEAAALLRRGGFLVGLHPEGTRNKGGDPYTFLPPQSGVGRVIHRSRVDVIPVFVNGLGNHLPRQVAGGLTGRGNPIHVVFGSPVDLSALLMQAGGPRTYKKIAAACLDAIGALGEEERRMRS